MTIKIGWIGCGRHATWMLMPQLARSGFEIAAVCDRDEASAQNAARQFGAKAVYSDYDDMIANADIDAVGMAVGPDIHFRATLSAMRRGLPVFMEKPPAATAAQAKELMLASEAAKVPVTVGFMKRYSTGNKIAKNILDGGDFGQILGIHGSYMTAPTYFTGEVDYTGFYLHHCVHYMDLITWFAGSEFADLRLRKNVPDKGKMLLHMNFECENGVIGNIIMGTVQSRGTPMEYVQIMGDHNRVEVENIINVAWHRNPPFKADDPKAVLDPACDSLVWTPNFTAAANEDHKGYHALLLDVAATMRGESDVAPQIRDGWLAMQRLERMIALIEA
ncbi:myo-inositol 2-dehydrogenase / D-chiro-inositol 1-dehydrogenase [Paracoccus alcaliphilus]|uniref:Myo-inositol 2-dehydrogenase / D-chiro-inositol 1-dehydrogenase n=1 Tax=Paracoccus alcaliphilus TaxID=34002 RepID=A0A1H8J559_9RHOB|nr:Gfo/Idh/MocA family oxidoreductase [Paracoccus alcaliphilus]WCR16671.1 Gfo/Idh/MocA family oxidoreductase [Paracoccus alcaliphilus]SEN75148.1 myo-inositol 2-dehydrogenase / D-chiro-inositol 1-dehydrogenase [Paracoccus alcaliphilus]